MKPSESTLNKELHSLLGRILGKFDPESIETFLVGGCVRDAIIGRPCQDVDVVTRGPVVQIARGIAGSEGGSLVIMGGDRQVARVVLPPHGAPTGTSQIDFSPLTTDLVEDLRRRDLTIDAMAVRLDGQALTGPVVLLDPFGGLRDLENGVIRATAPDAFQRDPARLLRAIRLASELDYGIDPATQSLMARDAGFLARVAGERIGPELSGMLVTRTSYRWLRLMEQLGLLRELFPELEEGRGISQPREHFWDVYDHNLETVKALDQLLGKGREAEDEYLASQTWPAEYAEHLTEDFSAGISRRAVVKLAGLLHDVAKPRARTVEDSGRIRFFGHHRLGSEMAGRIMRRLRFGRRESELVRTVIRHHLRPGLMSKRGQLPTPRAVYRFFRDAGDFTIDTVIVNLADYRAARGPLLGWDEWREYAERCRYILATGLSQARSDRPSPLVDGNDLMRELSLSPGPVVGRLLEEIREARAAGEIDTRKAALELAGKSLESSGVDG